MCGVFAEFERSMIVERVKAGLDRARAQGKILGRPRVKASTEALGFVCYRCSVRFWASA
jgi:DNA invertase Pin-like site-specific DNA recombinase